MVRVSRVGLPTSQKPDSSLVIIINSVLSHSSEAWSLEWQQPDLMESQRLFQALFFGPFE